MARKLSDLSIVIIQEVVEQEWAQEVRLQKSHSEQLYSTASAQLPVTTKLTTGK